MTENNRPSYSEEICPGIELRRAFDDDEITGVTILYFTQKFKYHEKNLSCLPFNINLNDIYNQMTSSL